MQRSILIELKSVLFAGTATGLLAACGGQPVFDPPVTVENCGGTARFEQPPQRVAALNQTAAELLLALELGDTLVATGMQDNEPAPEWAAAYRAIPVHWPGYPAAEAFVGVQPDFAYATLASAFGHDVQRARETLRPLGIEVYVSPWACRGEASSAEPVSVEPVAREIREVAEIFGVQARGAELITKLRERLEVARFASSQRLGPPPVVVWFVSGEEKPLFGSGQGILQLATEAAGAIHLYADSPGSYTSRTWEQFAAREANWIGLVDQASSSAANKRALLTTQPETANLRAVVEERFVVVSFSDTLPGVGVAKVAERLASAIDRDLRSLGRKPVGDASK